MRKPEFDGSFLDHCIFNSLPSTNDHKTSPGFWNRDIRARHTHACVSVRTHARAVRVFSRGHEVRRLKSAKVTFLKVWLISLTVGRRGALSPNAQGRERPVLFLSAFSSLSRLCKKEEGSVFLCASGRRKELGRFGGSYKNPRRLRIRNRQTSGSFEPLWLPFEPKWLPFQRLAPFPMGPAAVGRGDRGGVQ